MSHSLLQFLIANITRVPLTDNTQMTPIPNDRALVHHSSDRLGAPHVTFTQLNAESECVIAG